MRQFQTSNSFHDNDGNLLVGRVTFYKKGTTQKQDIMNEAGTIISNPIYTNQIGQTSQQVFLDDVDYTVVFEKYIGNGNMETDTNEEHWLFQYSSIDLYDTFNIKVETAGLQAVPSIIALRDTNPDLIAEQTGQKVVLLTGYYEAGDKPMIQYIWDESSDETDDGGSVIKVNDIGLGRWVLLPDQYDMIDVRHFGALPANSVNNLTENQAYCIQNANSYAAKSSDKIYFPAGIYRVQHNLSNCVFDEGSYVCVPNGYNVTIKCAENSMNFVLGQATGYIGVCTIEGSHLHYDCVKGLGGYQKDYTNVTFKPSERFDLDANVVRPLTVKDVDLYIKSGVTYAGGKSNLVFENCEIHSNKAITNNLQCTLKRCVIKQDMFADNLNFNNISLVDCYVNLSNFTDVMFYVKFKNALNDPNYGDLNGMSLTDSIELLNNAYVYNAKGTANVKAGNSITAENSTITVKNYCYKLTAKDSTVTLPYATYYDCRNSNITETANGTCNTCTMNNCTYMMYGNKKYTDMHMYDCNLNGNATTTLELIGSPSDIDSCTFPRSTKIIATQSPSIRNSRFGALECKINCKPTIVNNYIFGTVSLDIYDQMEFNFNSNKIEGQLTFTNSSEVVGAIVRNASIIDNHKINGSTLVKWNTKTITDNWFDEDDSKHNYTYQSNTEYNFKTGTDLYLRAIKTTASAQDKDMYCYYKQIDNYSWGAQSNTWAYPTTSNWHWGTNQTIEGFAFSFGKQTNNLVKFEVLFEETAASGYVVPKAYVEKYSYGGSQSGGGGDYPRGTYGDNGFGAFKVPVNSGQSTGDHYDARIYRGHGKATSFFYNVMNAGEMSIDSDGRRILSYKPNCYLDNTFADYNITTSHIPKDTNPVGDNNKKIKYKVITHLYW